MKVHQPYAKMLGKMDYRKEAWKTSRPNFTKDDIQFDEVGRMDLSLNSMLVFTIEMRSSVIMRDLIFSLRPIEGWALSTRCMPLDRSTVRLSGEFEGFTSDDDRIGRMFSLMKEGASRDQARGVLPCSVSSTYTFTIDFRVLMSFVKTLEEVSSDLFDLYGRMLLDATGTQDDYHKTTVHSSYEYYRINDDERINGIQQVGNMVCGHYRMKMALASQFLRQHYSKIKISLWDNIDDYFIMDLCQNDMVDIVFYIDVNSYGRLMAMRSHWLIDWAPDMWGGIVGDYISGMSTEEFWHFLPNGAGKTDPYWADVYNRITLEDPGIVCPISTEWRGAIDERRAEYPNCKILDRYEALFDEGFIEDNLNNKYRVEHLKRREKNNGERNKGVKV